MSILKKAFDATLKPAKWFLDSENKSAAALMNIGGTVFSALSGERARKKQIAWERERAQNAHQWEVQDLINAGLNPILSAGGSGAVTGGISAPVADTSGLQNSAAEAMRLKNESNLAKAEVDKSKSQTTLNQVNAELGELQKALTEEQTAATANQVRKSAAEAAYAEAELAAAEPLLETDRKYNNSTVGRSLHYFNRGWGDIGTAATVGGMSLLGGLKLFGAKATAKAAARKAASEKFAKSIMKDSGKIPLPILDPRNFK